MPDLLLQPKNLWLTLSPKPELLYLQNDGDNVLIVEVLFSKSNEKI